MKKTRERDPPLHKMVFCVLFFSLASFVQTQKKIEEKERQLESVPLSRFCPIIIYILIESGLKSARALVSTERKDHHHHHHHPRGFSIIPREREREREKKKRCWSRRARRREKRVGERYLFFCGHFSRNVGTCHERARPTRRRKT